MVANELRGRLLGSYRKDVFQASLYILSDRTPSKNPGLFRLLEWHLIGAEVDLSKLPIIDTLVKQPQSTVDHNGQHRAIFG